MSSDRFQKVKDLFHAVIGTPGVDREEALARTCPDDRELREGVRRVLTLVDRSGQLGPDVVDSLLWEASAPQAPSPEPATMTFKPLEMLGRYCIIGQIGEGGMGLVWKAIDTSLDREVAIKLLPARWTKDAERLARFRREAKIVASLDHPNIVIIHAVEEAGGVPFIVMELVGGRLLRQCIPVNGLPLSQLLDYTIPVADALAVAHGRGVTHRDLKPENIMVTGDGRIKVLDFGLAKREELRASGEMPGLESGLLSREVVMGTPPYMSPEQLRGQPTGPPSDVFSLGILLYEIAVGRRPFVGTSMLDVVSAILREPAPAPSSSRADLPAEFDAIVASCLEKESARRPATAQPVLDRLKALRRERERAALRNLAEAHPSTSRATLSLPTGRETQTLAVMPFQDLSPQRDLGYLCSGIAEDIATALSRVENLRVTVVSRIDRHTMDPMEMARLLGVTSFLDGSVARAGDRVRVTVRLVNTGDAAQVWSSRFDRPVQDTFAIQDEAAEAVAGSLQMRLKSGEQGFRGHDPAAYAAYLKGRFFWGQRYEGGLRRALQCFEEAIQLDGRMAAAHAGRADCFSILGHYGILDPTLAYARARQAAERAVEIDPDHTEAHATLAWIAAFYDWSWDRAASLFQRSFELDPTYATAWEWHGIYLLSRGRADEAMASLRRAQRADPLSLMISSILGWALDTMRAPEESMRVLHNVLEMDPRFVFAYTVLAGVLATGGRYDEAVNTAERGAMLSGRAGLSLALLGYVYGASGRIEDADAVIAEIGRAAPDRYVSPLHVALVHLGARRLEEALAHLEHSVAARESFFCTMHFDPLFDPLRDTPRFQALLRRMNLDAAGTS